MLGFLKDEAWKHEGLWERPGSSNTERDLRGPYSTSKAVVEYGGPERAIRLGAVGSGSPCRGTVSPPHTHCPFSLSFSSNQLPAPTDSHQNGAGAWHLCDHLIRREGETHTEGRERQHT